MRLAALARLVPSWPKRDVNPDGRIYSVTAFKARESRARPRNASQQAAALVPETEIRLTRSDLQAMPADLRHRLLDYLEGAGPSDGADTAGSPIDRRQIAALLREISFHRDGTLLRALLDRLSYRDTDSPPTRRRLEEALPPGERPRFGRYIALLNRLAGKAAMNRDTRLCRLARRGMIYTAHPTTRRWLRELLPGIEHAGENEEPLWE